MLDYLPLMLLCSAGYLWDISGVKSKHGFIQVQILNSLINSLQAYVEDGADQINHWHKASVVEKEVQSVVRSFSKSKQITC